MTRPDKVQCEECDLWIEQAPVGAPRRFCASCLAVRNRESSRAWRERNPDAHRRHNRDSARRRRRDGRLT
jgi:hypothetical protein